MTKQIEQLFLDRILFIGEKIPEALSDERAKFVMLGTPAELIKKLEDLLNN